MLYIDGVFDRHGRFYPLKAPTPSDLDSITHQIAQRVSRHLEKAGYLVRDAESAYLDLQTDDDDAMVNIVGASISYRLAFGPNAGRKALTLQTLPTRDTEDQRSLVTKQSGFSVHAGVSCKAGQQKKLERLCRYITRPAISEQRLSTAANGNVIYALKTPYSDGTTGTPSHMSCSVRWNSSAGWQHWSSPAAPKPRVKLTGTPSQGFMACSRRTASCAEKWCQENRPRINQQTNRAATAKRGRLGWAQRLKRVFAIDIEKCEKCGGKLKVIASIEDPDVIEKILKHLGLDQASRPRSSLHNRSPPENMFEHTTTLF